MATVRIGDRDLRVLESWEAGSFRVTLNLTRAREALVKAQKGDDAAAILNALVDLVFCWVGPPVNADVTKESLAEVLPADPSGVIRDCVAAAAKKRVEPAKEVTA